MPQVAPGLAFRHRQHQPHAAGCPLPAMRLTTESPSAVLLPALPALGMLSILTEHLSPTETAEHPAACDRAIYGPLACPALSPWPGPSCVRAQGTGLRQHGWPGTGSGGGGGLERGSRTRVILGNGE